MNVMIDRAHIWNVIYNAQTNSHHLESRKLVILHLESIYVNQKI